MVIRGHGHGHLVLISLCLRSRRCQTCDIETAVSCHLFGDASPAEVQRCILFISERWVHFYLSVCLCNPVVCVRPEDFFVGLRRGSAICGEAVGCKCGRLSTNQSVNQSIASKASMRRFAPFWTVREIGFSSGPAKATGGRWNTSSSSRAAKESAASCCPSPTTTSR